MKPNIIRWIIHIIFYLILFTPLLVWSKFLFPFITLKTIYFRSLVEIGLFFYLLLIVYLPEYRPRFSKITWALLVYLLIMTFASIFGVNPYRSFWGNIERGEGLLTLYHLFIFFFLLSAVLKDKKEWLRFFDVSVFASLLVSLYGLAQRLNFSFVVHPGAERVMSTLGNPTFVAAYLLIHLFILLYLLVHKRELGWRIYYCLVFVFELIMIFFTQTRGALIGLFVGFLLLAFFSAIFAKAKKIKLGFVGLVFVLIVLSVVVWTLRDSAFVQSIPGVSRLVTISADDITTQSRILAWRASWQGWRDRFLFGYGYENYNIAFNKYFPVEIYKDPGSQIWFDRAHNVIFDQAVAGGIFGLLAYLGIFAAALAVLLSKLKRSFGAVILVALLAGYFLQNIFVFDSLASYIMFYALLAFVGFLQSVDSSQRKEQNNNNSNQPLRKPSVFLVFVLILLFVFVIHFFNIRLAWANHFIAQALAYAHVDNYSRSIQLFQKMLAKQSNQVFEARQHLAQVTNRAIRSSRLTKDEKIQLCNYTIDELKKNIDASPQDAYYYLFLMNIYNNCAVFDSGRLNLAIQAGQRALELSPTRPQFYYQMGQAAINAGRYEEGIDYFKKAVELAPNVTEAQWNLAAAYIMTGQNELAEEQFAKMTQTMSFNYYSMQNLRRLVRPYLFRKDFHKIAFLYEEMIKLQPMNADLYAKLAAAYKEIGEIEKAKAAVKKAVELDSSYAPEAESFLKLLEE